MTSQTWRRRTLIGLVFLVAAAVLGESWQAAMHAADHGGRPTPGLWPVVLEGFIVVLILVFWDARSDDRKVGWVRTTAWLVTVAAALVQALDAPRTWLGVVTAAITPVILLAAVEFAVWLLYGAGAPKLRDPGLPGRTAGGVADLAGNHRQARGATPRLAESQASSLAPATPPPVTPDPEPARTPMVGPAGRVGGNLPDQPRSVGADSTAAVDRDLTEPRPPWARLEYLGRQVYYGRINATKAGAAVADLTVEEWIGVLVEHGWRCGYCQVDDLPLEMDHRVPPSRGGDHSRANVIPACRICNAAKGNLTEEEYRANPSNTSNVMLAVREDGPRPPIPPKTGPVGLSPADEAALYRQRANPDRFAQIIAERELDPDAIMQLAARRRWPVANGHKEATPV